MAKLGIGAESVWLGLSSFWFVTMLSTAEMPH